MSDPVKLVFSKDAQPFREVIPKNKREDIVVSLKEYNGTKCVDVRIFAPFGETAEKLPTKKGVAVNARLLPQLIEALVKAQAEARRIGFIDA